jgi:cytidylate kinase
MWQDYSDRLPVVGRQFLFIEMKESNMAIITISRGSYSRGKEVAESLAGRLGYECVSRDILLEACEEFSIPEIKLVKALHDAPSVLERFKHGKIRYISYLRSAFFNHMVNDNIVYHGLAGHFFLQGISHVMKVRILANMEDRVKEEMKRENASEEEARYMLRKDDDERRRWGLALYGHDTWDCNLYDAVLRIDTLTVDDVVNTLHALVQTGRFDTSKESLNKLKNRALLANIHAHIVNYAPHATIEYNDGIITLGNLEGLLKSDKEQRRKTTKMIVETYGVKDVVFAKPAVADKDHINPFYNIDFI